MHQDLTASFITCVTVIIRLYECKETHLCLPPIACWERCSDCEPETECVGTEKRVHELKHGLFMAVSSVPVWEVGGRPRAGSDNGAGGGRVRSRRQTVFTTNSGGRPRHWAHHPSAVTWSTPAAPTTGTHTLTNPPLVFRWILLW